MQLCLKIISSINVYVCLIQAEEWYKEKFANIKA